MHRTRRLRLRSRSNVSGAGSVIRDVRHTHSAHHINEREHMKTQTALVTSAIVLSCGLLWLPPMKAAEQPASSAAQRAHDEAQQLLRDRDEARPKAKAAEKKLREAGV